MARVTTYDGVLVVADIASVGVGVEVSHLMWVLFTLLHILSVLEHFVEVVDVERGRSILSERHLDEFRLHIDQSTVEYEFEQRHRTFLHII